MTGKSAGKGLLLLIVFIILGLTGGSLLSQLLRPYLPLLGKAVTVGFEPKAPVALGDIFRFWLGFRLRLDLASMSGLILALWLYWRI